MNMQIDYETERELGIDYETLAVKVADWRRATNRAYINKNIYYSILYSSLNSFFPCFAYFWFSGVSS